MEKEQVKRTICEAIDNIPDVAEIVDVYTEHSYADSKARIIICVKMMDETDEDSLIAFHNIAHNAFNVDMGFIS